MFDHILVCIVFHEKSLVILFPLCNVILLWFSLCPLHMMSFAPISAYVSCWSEHEYGVLWWCFFVSCAWGLLAFLDLWVCSLIKFGKFWPLVVKYFCLFFFFFWHCCFILGHLILSRSSLVLCSFSFLPQPFFSLCFVLESFYCGCLGSVILSVSTNPIQYFSSLEVWVGLFYIFWVFP